MSANGGSDERQGLRFVDLGADFHDRLHPQRRTRQLIRELEHLSGTQVTLHDAA